MTTQADIMKHTFCFSIGDGRGYYIVAKIKAGNVYLTKVQNHPDNPDNYGELQRIIPYNQAVARYELTKLLGR